MKQNPNWLRNLFLANMIGAFLVSGHPIALCQADSFCPRRVEVMTYGYKNISANPDKIILDKDDSFNRAVFLQHFARLFRTPRLIFNVTGKPEYSLTATYYKIMGYRHSTPKSLLGIVLSWNGGEECEGHPGHVISDGSNPYSINFHGFEIIMKWTSIVEGWDLSDHISIIQEKISQPPGIDQALNSFEQIPIGAQPKKDYDWCDWDDKRRPGELDPYRITLNNFVTAAPLLDGHSTFHHTHLVRLIARADRGFIKNGDFIKEDHRAKAFTVDVPFNSKSALDIDYVPPDGDDKSDTIHIYNSCEICREKYVPLNETRKKDEILKIEVGCIWEGTISETWEMKAGEDESVLAAITHRGEYDAGKNWKVRVKFKKDRGNENVEIYSLDEAWLGSFSEILDFKGMRGERDGAKMEMTGRDRAEERSRKLSKKELDLELALNLKKKTYSIRGHIKLAGIANKGESRLNVKAGPIAVDEREPSGGTTGIDDSIEIAGTFKDKRPQRLNGSRDNMAKLPSEWQDFFKTMAGKIDWKSAWDLSKKTPE